MATQTRASTEIVPLRLPPESAGALEDPRLSDVDEWGRSEHARALARQLYEPIYSKWFRAEWDGLERIPTRAAPSWWPTTPAPSPPTPRSSCTASRRSWAGPSTAWPTTSSVGHRCWGPCGHGWAASRPTPTTPTGSSTTSSQLALVFPEGTKGPSKSYTDRYQLRRFGRGGFVEIAMRAGVPVVPIAVVGSEETMPVILRLPRLAHAMGIPYFPITANFLMLGPGGGGRPLPR